MLDLIKKIAALSNNLGFKALFNRLGFYFYDIIYTFFKFSYNFVNYDGKIKVFLNVTRYFTQMRVLILNFLENVILVAI